jgi:hypothetical protein
MKCNALYDYNFEITSLRNKFKDFSIDYLIGHVEHDNYDTFFNAYLSQYENRVLSFPLGYHSDIIKYRGNKNKINKILGLGAIAPIEEKKNYPALEEYYHFFQAKRIYSHEEREWFRKHKLSLNDIFDCYFPEPPIQRNELQNEQHLLSQYTHFLSDLGSLTFLPARIYEGIAIGSIPIMIKHDIYRKYGFNDSNSILFDSLDEKKIRKTFYHFLENKDIMSQNALQLSERYTFKNVSNFLKIEIEKKYLGK